MLPVRQHMASGGYGSWVTTSSLEGQVLLQRAQQTPCAHTIGTWQWRIRAHARNLTKCLLQTAAQ